MNRAGTRGTGWRLAMMLPIWAMLAGCSDERGEPVALAEAGGQAPMAVVETTPAGSALAWVDGEPVGHAELDYFLEQRLNIPAYQAREPALRRKALESLVSARSMARLAERELDADERAAVEIATAFYREELLTRRYLEATVEPVPVSDAMVRDYYAAHAEEFGQRTLKEIEWLATLEGLEPSRREALLETFEGLGDRADWEALAVDLNGAGAQVDFKRGEFAPALLPPRLRSVVAATAVGETSGLHLVRGRLHRVRVVGAREQPARALAEVSDEIRRRLAPQQMRAAVKAASRAVQDQVTVKYAADADAADG